MVAPLEATSDVVIDSTYDFAGYRFRLVSEVEDAGRLTHELFMPHQADVGGEPSTYYMRRVPGHRHRYTLHRDDDCLLDETRAYPAALVDFVASDVTRKAIEAQDGFLVVHAAAASWMGRGVVMPAGTGSGKTTTVAGLVRAGFDYLTDEAALIDPSTRMVHPFPRPLALDLVSPIEGLSDELPVRYHDLMRRQQYYVPCDFIRAGSLGEPCRIDYVIVPRYSPGSATRLDPMSRAEALTLAAEQSFNFDRYGSDGLSLLAEVLRDAHCFRLHIGNLQDAVALVEKLVAAN